MSVGQFPLGAVVVAYLVLGVAPWPVYRLVSLPSFRREYSCLAIRVGLLIASYFAFLAAISVFLPELIVPMAIVAACLLIAERWRARANFGQRSNYPPGSLTLVPRGPWVDDRFFGKQADRYGPVFKMSHFFRPMVCVLGPREGLQLFRESSDRLITPPMRFSAFIPNGFLRYMEPAVHEKYRAIFRRAFSKAVLSECRPYFEAVLARDLSKMAALSRKQPGDGIHPASYISDVVFKLVVRLFIGVNETSDEMSQLQELYERVVIGKTSCSPAIDEAQVNDAITGIILRQVEKAPATLPACFLAEIVRKDANAARERTVVMNLVYMIKIVTSDLSGLFTWLIKLLTDNQQWTEKLYVAAENSECEGEQVATLILKESLRLERSEFIFRKAAAPIEYKGFTIPKNWIVRVCIRDGHRDPNTFPDPDTFNPDRFSKRSYSREEYSPLGLGAHSCLGEQVIYTLGPAFLIELTRSFEIHKLRDGPREYGRSHWEPSSTLRIELIDRKNRSKKVESNL